MRLCHVNDNTFRRLCGECMRVCECGHMGVYACVCVCVCVCEGECVRTFRPLCAECSRYNFSQVTKKKLKEKHRPLTSWYNSLRNTFRYKKVLMYFKLYQTNWNRAEAKSRMLSISWFSSVSSPFLRNFIDPKIRTRFSRNSLSHSHVYTHILGVHSHTHTLSLSLSLSTDPHTRQNTHIHALSLSLSLNWPTHTHTLHLSS